MSARLVLTVEGDTAQLLAFVLRLRPIIEELDIQTMSSETVAVPECPDCTRDLEDHKGHWTCVNASCARYGESIRAI